MPLVIVTRATGERRFCHAQFSQLKYEYIYIYMSIEIYIVLYLYICMFFYITGFKYLFTCCPSLCI